MALNSILNDFVRRDNVILVRIGLLGHGMIKDVLVGEIDSFGELAVAVDINTNESRILIFRCRLLPLVAVVRRQLLLEGHLNLDLL